MGRLRRRMARAGLHERVRSGRSSRSAEIVLPAIAFGRRALYSGGRVRAGSSLAILAAMRSAISFPASWLSPADRASARRQIRERAARRARPAHRLPRGRLEPRPGHREGERRARARLPGARRGAPDDHHRDPRRQAAPRSVQELRGAHEGGRRPLARRHAGADRPLRHQRRAGAAHARRDVAHQAPAARPRRRPRRSA